MASEDEFNKAMVLNDTELNGNVVRLERGRKMDKTPQRGGDQQQRQGAPSEFIVLTYIECQNNVMTSFNRTTLNPLLQIIFGHR